MGWVIAVIYGMEGAGHQQGVLLWFGNVRLSTTMWHYPTSLGRWGTDRGVAVRAEWRGGQEIVTEITRIGPNRTSRSS